MDESYINDSTILLVKHGSHAYGLNTETSDLDEKGVCVLPDKRYYIGMGRFEQKDGGWSDDADRQIYDVRKFIRLALACNPNIIEILFVDNDDILKITPEGERLIEKRDIFLSRKAANTFIGYAVSQLRRIQGHKKWLDDPPEEPSEASFTYTHALSPGESWEREFSDHVVKVDTSASFKVLTPAIVVHKDRRAYKAANKKWRQYQTWRENRNPERAAMEKEFGLDCKHAMHLMRLLRMGTEIIKTGRVIVKRPDRESLLDIRRGKFDYDEILEQAESMMSDIRSDAIINTSPLPEEPDYEAAEELLMDLIQTKVFSANRRETTEHTEVTQ